MVHSDKRRDIYDWANGNYKSLKAVFIKEPIAVGNHYHLNKDEVFFLAVGHIRELVLGDTVKYNIDPPYVINVPRGVYHSFVCIPGSIIFSGATELFDENDEIKHNAET